MGEKMIPKNLPGYTDTWPSDDEYRLILKRAKGNIGRRPLTEIEMLALLGESISRTYTYAERNYK